MAWIYLLAAGICEVVWAVGLKASQGFTKPAAGVFTIIMMLLSFVLLSQAMRTLPLGTAYTIWTGIGAVGTVLWGMYKLGEPSDLPRMICIALIVIGIAGLKWVTKA
jgi:quaternary ammonium compound-resistance protein SugE